MLTPSAKRLMRDFRRLQKDPPEGICACPQDCNIMLWNALIFGPNDTIWDGGTFKLTLEFSEDYPNKPPIVRFVSKMFHPNVHPDGTICLDILGNRWTPVYDVAAILTSIQSLLCDPNSNSMDYNHNESFNGYLLRNNKFYRSPANEAAALFASNKREYYRKVREIVEQSWTTD